MLKRKTGQLTAIYEQGGREPAGKVGKVGIMVPWPGYIILLK